MSLHNFPSYDLPQLANCPPTTWTVLRQGLFLRYRRPVVQILARKTPVFQTLPDDWCWSYQVWFARSQNTVTK